MNPLYIILPITVISVLFTLIRVMPTIKSAKQLVANLPGNNPEAARLMQVGIPTNATITQVQMGQGTVMIHAHRHLQLHIQLQIHPQGAAPYPVQVTSMVSELRIPQFQPNAVVQVRVDPVNPHNVALI